jgi:NAD(P)-dependent dehydrogenase (short-subunit alcohol dehydrogenase family)
VTRRALVTGVTSGLGEHVAVALARRGHEVVLAARNPDKLRTTLGLVREAVPGAALHPLVVDLADLASVRRAAAEAAALGPLHVLVNNAGVMATPHRRTVDGFELQLGTNHLGHFALTGLLLPALLGSGGARVVTVSSLAARAARAVPTGDPRESRRYRKWSAYAESKLANLLFTVELDRRARQRDWQLTAVAAHPGYSATNLVDSGLNLGRRRVAGAIGVAVTRLVGQSAEAGAQPLVMAATEPGLEGGTYLGPGGPGELHGAPQVVRLPRRALDADLAARLWASSERATGVAFQ